MDSKSKRIFDNLTEDQQDRVKEEHRRAHNYDTKDPLFGLTQAELSGPQINRRSFLRLLAASGAALPLRGLMAAAGMALPAVAKVAAQAGGELTAIGPGVLAVRFGLAAFNRRYTRHGFNRCDRRGFGRLRHESRS